MARDPVLFVYAKGGAPLEYALPALAQATDVHLLALSPLPAHTRHLWSQSVVSMRSVDVSGGAAVAEIVATAQRVGAKAVLALSEFLVVSVAQAAEILGLQGAGPNVVRSRDKRLMRRTWRDTGVPSPRFRAVSSTDDLRDALDQLRLPVLLKAAWGAGSVAQTVISKRTEADRAWATATSALRAASRNRFRDLSERASSVDLLVEEIIEGSTEGWFERGSGYGDYLSIEGIVDHGRYHPLCITTRLPTIPPFTEVSNLAPCVLSEDKQRRIESIARRAVDALGLDTCATHTEMKLQRNGDLCLIESAARFGGVNIVRQIETVFDIKPIQMLARALLGEPVEYPDQMLTAGRAAAASLSIIATDASGQPWRRERPIWNSKAVDWSKLLSAESAIETVIGLSLPDGTPMPISDGADGSLAYAGLFFLKAPDAETLVRDSYSVLNGLESALGEPVRRLG